LAEAEGFVDVGERAEGAGDTDLFAGGAEVEADAPG
jgi:hypothetical protein